MIEYPICSKISFKCTKKFPFFLTMINSQYSVWGISKIKSYRQGRFLPLWRSGHIRLTDPLLGIHFLLIVISEISLHFLCLWWRHYWHTENSEICWNKSLGLFKINICYAISKLCKFFPYYNVWGQRNGTYL